MNKKFIAKLPVIQIFILTLIIFLAACGRKSNDSLMIGKWQFSRYDLTKNDEYDSLEVREIKETEPEMRKTALEFFNDHSYKSTSSDHETEKGTYSLVGNGKSLQLDRGNDADILQYDIIMLDSDSLKLESEEVDMVYRRIRE